MFYTHQMDAQHKPTGPYNGPTADKRVRQAIAYAVDADEIIKGVLDGKAQRVATMLPSMHFGYDPSLKPIKQDLAKTKKPWPRPASPTASRSRSTARRGATCATRKWPRRSPAS